MRPEAMAEKLLVLTLAAEEAFSEERWFEADAIMSERMQCIEWHERMGAQLPADIFAKIQETERRIAEQMNQRKAEVVTELRKLADSSKVLKRYARVG